LQLRALRAGYRRADGGGVPRRRSAREQEIVEGGTEVSVPRRLAGKVAIVRAQTEDAGWEGRGIENQRRDQRGSAFLVEKPGGKPVDG